MSLDSIHYIYVKKNTYILLTFELINIVIMGFLIIETWWVKVSVPPNYMKNTSKKVSCFIFFFDGI